jgi:hypothetical protein
MLLEVGDGKPYSTAQAAINAGIDGVSVRLNEVLATGNAYPEAILVNNKRVRLFGKLGAVGAGPLISVTGAGGGASPALQVTGTGGVQVENLNFSNVGSAATYVVELNVAEDWITRCIIDGGGTARCLQAQFGDTVLLKNGTHGNTPSCPGQVLLANFTCVNMTTWGIGGNAVSGTFQNCLAYNCNAQGFTNALFQYCCTNFSDDVTAPGPDSTSFMALADIGFVNYAGGDFRLLTTSLAYSPGIPPNRLDLLGNRRMRRGPNNRIYGGCYEPFPAAPVFLTGGSSIRGF